MLISTLLPTVKRLSHQEAFNQISPQRKLILEALARFVHERLSAGRPARINFICTHNSRRSHLAQIWTQAASVYYDIDRVECFSGGTEATAFNSRAVKAMRHAGFQITALSEGDNPVYDVKFAEDAESIRAFSKRYDDTSNPQSDFAAVMTCGQADEDCPVVTGATIKIALTYDDPKSSDGSPEEGATYAERVDEIGREMLFAFSIIAKQ